LVIKLGSIGDIIHTLPAFAAMRKARPDAEISWVVESRSAEILRGNALIDDLVEVDTRSLRGRTSLDDALVDISRQIKHLRRKKFDISIDFQGLLKSALIGQLSGASRRWGFDKAGLREPPSRFLLTDTVETPAQVHVIQKNIALASAALGIDLPGSNLEFPISTEDEHKVEAATITTQAGGRFALLNPAGGWVTKLWPAARFAQLADWLWAVKGVVSVIATGPN
jgi:heptosyltransferase-1